MSSKKAETKRFNDVVFISYELTKQQREHLKGTEWLMEHNDQALSSLLEQEYKVTFRWDNYNECFACWIIPPGEKSPNYGYILTGRGSSPTKALKQVFYIHEVLFERAWASHTQSRDIKELDD